MRKQKGFTLVELLIVVVIIAVLASLILPRMMAQPERAVIAEAQQMLGAIRRAQMVARDMNNDVGIDFTNTSSTGWGKLGFKALPDSSSFEYGCEDNGANCTATLKTKTANFITLNTESGGFSCDGDYSEIITSGTNVKGCTVA